QSIADPVQPQALRSPRIRQPHLDRGEPGQVLVSALIGVCARLGDERFDDLLRRLQPPGTPFAAGELEVEFVPAVPARADDVRRLEVSAARVAPGDGAEDLVPTR